MKNKTFQIKLSRLIIGGILLLWLILLAYFKPTPNVVDKYAKEKIEIDSLQNEIGKLKGLNSQLGNEIYLQTKVMDSLNQEIKTTEKELTQTRTYYGNKIKDLNSSSPSELNEFFTERYH
jgi:predicted  nucleic acid-binding Zn-ribbon protein